MDFGFDRFWKRGPRGPLAWRPFLIPKLAVYSSAPALKVPRVWSGKCKAHTTTPQDTDREPSRRNRVGCRWKRRQTRNCINRLRLRGPAGVFRRGWPLNQAHHFAGSRSVFSCKPCMLTYQWLTPTKGMEGPKCQFGTVKTSPEGRTVGEVYRAAVTVCTSVPICGGQIDPLMYPSKIYPLPIASRGVVDGKIKLADMCARCAPGHPDRVAPLGLSFFGQNIAKQGPSSAIIARSLDRAIIRCMRCAGLANAIGTYSGQHTPVSVIASARSSASSTPPIWRAGLGLWAGQFPGCGGVCDIKSLSHVNRMACTCPFHDFPIFHPRQKPKTLSRKPTGLQSSVEGLRGVVVVMMMKRMVMWRVPSVLAVWHTFATTLGAPHCYPFPFRQG